MAETGLPKVNLYIIPLPSTFTSGKGIFLSISITHLLLSSCRSLISLYFCNFVPLLSFLCWFPIMKGLALGCAAATEGLKMTC